MQLKVFDLNHRTKIVPALEQRLAMFLWVILSTITVLLNRNLAKDFLMRIDKLTEGKVIAHLATHQKRITPPALSLSRSCGTYSITRVPVICKIAELSYNDWQMGRDMPI